MNKNFLLIVCIMWTGVIAGQALNLQPGASQQLLENAVKDGLIIVHRYYQLQDVSVAPPANYGWNNQPHFGDSWSLAVKTSGGCLLSDAAVHPWTYDGKFGEYRSQTRYRPVYFKSEYRHMDTAVYLPVAIPDSVVAVSAGRLYQVADSVFGNRGFVLDHETGAKDGWLVWLVSRVPVADNAAQPFSLVAHRSELTFTGSQSQYEVRTLSTERVILGGIYVLPQVTGVGQITVKLSGVLHKENDKWYVVKLASSAASASSETSGAGVLTPAPTLTPAGAASSAAGNAGSSQDSSKKTGRKRK
jgi:hypothetical protein